MRSVQQTMFPDLRSARAVGPLVPSVITGNNAELIRRIAPLYLDGRSVLDVTYGEGAWWTEYRPADFTFHTGNDVDFRALPHDDGSFDVVIYDPPYVPAGGDATSTAGDFQDRYGLRGGRNQGELDDLMRAGLIESARVARMFVLVKCQDFVNGGSFTPQSYKLDRWATDAGLVMHDEIVHHSGSGPGGHNIVDQLRARRHHSKLLAYTPRKVYS